VADRDALRLLRELEKRRMELITGLFDGPMATYEQYSEAYARCAELRDTVKMAREIFKGEEDSG
jgi:hypothetical protein